MIGICAAIGVTNQRETTLVWDKETGEPLYNAIGTVECYLIYYFHFDLLFPFISGFIISTNLCLFKEYVADTIVSYFNRFLAAVK